MEIGTILWTDVVIKNRCILFYLVYIDACKQIANPKPHSQLEEQNTGGEERDTKRPNENCISALEF